MLSADVLAYEAQDPTPGTSFDVALAATDALEHLESGEPSDALVALRLALASVLETWATFLFRALQLQRLPLDQQSAVIVMASPHGAYLLVDDGQRLHQPGLRELVVLLTLLFPLLEPGTK